LTGPDVAEDVGAFGEGVAAVEDRRDLSGRKEVGQGERALLLTSARRTPAGVRERWS
jgi:hypothetical protein